jgi:hypothetical protein
LEIILKVEIPNAESAIVAIPGIARGRSTVGIKILGKMTAMMMGRPRMENTRKTTVTLSKDFPCLKIK